MIVLIAIWNVVVSFIAITALIGGYENYKEIEAIKSWYPFCEIMKMKLDEEQSNGKNTESKGNDKTVDNVQNAKR